MVAPEFLDSFSACCLVSEPNIGNFMCNFFAVLVRNLTHEDQLLWQEKKDQGFRVLFQL